MVQIRVWWIFQSCTSIGKETRPPTPISLHKPCSRLNPEKKMLAEVPPTDAQGDPNVTLSNIVRPSCNILIGGGYAWGERKEG